MQTYQTPEEMREEYINTHQHGWTMHQEADWWLKKLQSREEWLGEEIKKKAVYTAEVELGANESDKMVYLSDILSLIKK